MESNMMDDGVTIHGPSRRAVLGSLAAGAAAAWTVPSIVSVPAASAATVAPPVTGPVVAGRSDGDVYTSADHGVTWAAATTPPGGGRYFRTIAGDGQDFAAVAGTGTACWVSSTGGDTWSPAATQLSGVQSVTNIGSNFVCVGGSTMWWSADNGNNWTETSTPPPTGGFLPVTLRAVATNGVVFVAVGIDDLANASSWQSTDNGVTWTTSTSLAVAGASDPQAVAGTGTHFAEIDSTGVFVSSDSGATWAAAASSPINLISLACSATAFVAITNAGEIWRSTDFGVTWPTATIPSVNFLYGVTYDGVNFVIVGESGYVLYSPDDGVTWLAATTPPPASGRLSAVGHG